MSTKTGFFWMDRQAVKDYFHSKHEGGFMLHKCQNGVKEPQYVTEHIEGLIKVWVTLDVDRKELNK